MGYYRRGTAIVETKKGILLTAGKNGIFMLPGGKARRGESRKKAAIRELREETGLIAQSCKYLFTYKGSRAFHKVFLIKAKGYIRPRKEIRYIAYWRPGSSLRLSKSTAKIIERYYQLKNKKDIKKKIKKFIKNWFNFRFV